MAHVVIDPAEFRNLPPDGGPIEVRTPQGEVLGTVENFLPAGLMEQVRKSRLDPRPSIPSDEVRRRLGLPKADVCLE